MGIHCKIFKTKFAFEVSFVKCHFNPVLCFLAFFVSQFYALVSQGRVSKILMVFRCNLAAKQVQASPMQARV